MYQHKQRRAASYPAYTILALFAEQKVQTARSFAFWQDPIFTTIDYQLVVSEYPSGSRSGSLSSSSKSHLYFSASPA